MTELSGTLDGVGLVAIVRFVGGLRKTGSLIIADREWQGTLEVVQGQVVGARLGDLQGWSALEALVQCVSAGTFAFSSERSPAAVGETDADLELSGDALQARLAELAEQTARGTQPLPSLDAGVSLVHDEAPVAAEPLSLDRASVQTLLAVDGQRTVRQIVALRGSLDVLWHLAALRDVGLVAVSAAQSTSALEMPPVQPDPAEPEPADQRPALDGAPSPRETPLVDQPVPPPAVTRPGCPLLGFEDDPANAFGRPTRLHRCFAAGAPLPLSLDQQRELCLSDQFATCPRLPITEPGVTDSRPRRASETSAPGIERPDGRIVRLPFVSRAAADDGGAAVDAPATSGRAEPARPTPLRAHQDRGPAIAPGGAPRPTPAHTSAVSPAAGAGPSAWRSGSAGARGERSAPIAAAAARYQGRQNPNGVAGRAPAADGALRAAPANRPGSVTSHPANANGASGEASSVRSVAQAWPSSASNGAYPSVPSASGTDEYAGEDDRYAAGDGYAGGHGYAGDDAYAGRGYAPAGLAAQRAQPAATAMAPSASGAAGAAPAMQSAPGRAASMATTTREGPVRAAGTAATTREGPVRAAGIPTLADSPAAPGADAAPPPPATPPRRSLRALPVPMLASGAVVLAVVAAMALLLGGQIGSLGGDDPIDPARLPNSAALVNSGQAPQARPTAAGAEAARTPAVGARTQASAAGDASRASTPAAAPASKTAATANATSTTGAGTPSATTDTRGTALLEESFASPTLPWPSDPQGPAQLSGGVYRLTPRQAGQFVAIDAPTLDVPTDVVVSATFRKLGGPPGGGYGLILRDQAAVPQAGAEQAGHYYVAEIGDRGDVGLWRRDGERWIDLLPWTHSDAVKPGTVTNQLTVHASGSTFTLSVNGTVVATRSDSTYADGAVGVFAGGDGNVVAADHFSVLAR